MLIHTPPSLFRTEHERSEVQVDNSRNQEVFWCARILNSVYYGDLVMIPVAEVWAAVTTKIQGCQIDQ